MKPMNDRTQLGQPRAAAAPAPRKRFSIEKLEERIAPHSCRARPMRSDPYCFTAWKCAG